MKNIPLKNFRELVLKDEEIREEYEKLKPAYDLRRKLIALRKEAGLTQEELAELLHTKKSNISRLENVKSTSSPRLSTLEEYARAVGYEVEIHFVRALG